MVSHQYVSTCVCANWLLVRISYYIPHIHMASLRYDFVTLRCFLSTFIMASVTIIWLFTSMNTYIRHQRTPKSTSLTFKRFFARMNALMYYQTIFLIKSDVTHITFIRFYTLATLYMNIQTTF